MSVVNESNTASFFSFHLAPEAVLEESVRGFLSPDRQVDGEEIPIYILLNMNVSAVECLFFFSFSLSFFNW